MSIFSDAERILEENGWGKSQLINEETGNMCILGGIGTAYGLDLLDGADEVYDLLNQTPELKILRDIIAESHPTQYYVANKNPSQLVDTVYGYNDADYRTFDEIKSLLREAEIRMGDIGEPVKTVEFEPMPETVPIVEPAAPAVAPAEEPVPA
jgi:hypothetical protein